MEQPDRQREDVNVMMGDNREEEKPEPVEQPDRHREDFNVLDPLILDGVIGDVLPQFVPVMEMAVYYGLTQVTNGCELAPLEAASPPNVQIAGNFEDGSKFTLVMVDPDAPSSADPSSREYGHEYLKWLVTDIPGGTDPTQGKEVLAYERPKPLGGKHRYVFALFKQTRPMMAIPPLIRNNFNTKCFAEEHGLGLPVAAAYFTAQGPQP